MHLADRDVCLGYRINQKEARCLLQVGMKIQRIDGYSVSKQSEIINTSFARVKVQIKAHVSLNF
jgi:hypothetical protein